MQLGVGMIDRQVTEGRSREEGDSKQQCLVKTFQDIRSCDIEEVGQGEKQKSTC